MQKKTRTIIIIGSIVVLIALIAGVSFAIYQTNQPTTTVEVSLKDRTNDELSSAITTNRPELINSGKPTFVIVDVKKPQTGWYIVTVRDQADTEGTNPAKLLLHSLGNGSNDLKVLIGPGTSFPNEDLQAWDVPGPVAEELNK